MPALVRVYEDETAIFGRVRNVALVGWREAPSVAAIRAWQRLGHTIGKDHPGAGACIDVIVRGTPRFGDDVRRAAEEMARDPKIFERGIAHVTLIPGLAGTAVRAFIQTILLVTRPPTPTKVFADVGSATTWMTPRISSAVPVEPRRHARIADTSPPPPAEIAAQTWTEPELRGVCDELVAALAP